MLSFRALLFSSFVLLSLNVRAESYYVSDEVAVPLHTGPSNQYRIRGWVDSGSVLDLLEPNEGSGYAKVRDERGREGWIAGKYFAEGESLRSRLPKVEAQLAERTEQLRKQSVLVGRLQAELSDSNDRRAQVVAELAQQQNEIDRLKSDLAAMDETNLMGWFLRGGGVMLAGLILGLLVPHLPKKRRRSEEWF